LAETENVILAAVSVTTVTGKSGFGRTLQAGVIILKSIGVWYSIVFAKCKCSCVCDWPNWTEDSTHCYRTESETLQWNPYCSWR